MEDFKSLLDDIVLDGDEFDPPELEMADPVSDTDAPDPADFTDATDATDAPAIQDALDVGNKSIDTYMDIVFCIDITGSMQPTIDLVKNFTTSLYDDLIPYMLDKCNREVKQLRAKVIGFRDFYYDGRFALEESDFFMLPNQNSEFKTFVGSLEAKGGGDDPESSLEAIALAMKTDWVKISDLNTQRARHVIVLFTDTAAHQLEDPAQRNSPCYPEGMPADYNELLMRWQGQGTCMDTENLTMDKRAKRLVVCAPEESYPWCDMAEEFENAVFLPMAKDSGGIDVAKDVIINTIGGTM